MIDTKAELLKQSFYNSDAAFTNLMKKRIFNVLLISSVYDAFMLEEDGRIDEQIFQEYTSLSLRYPPQFFKATSSEESFQVLGEENIDLVITMLSAEKRDTLSLAQKIKAEYPDIPIVMLTPFSREVSLKVTILQNKSVDYVFSWLGNADILLAIIKLIEDKMNAEYDVLDVGVQVIILVEDNIRFYSSYLPIMYKIIFKQSQTFVSEGLNEHQRMLRMRGRPKILLATDYNEAVALYEKYQHYVLGIVSDISYPRDGVMDKEAGFRLSRKVKKDNKYTPVLLQSSNPENRWKAKEIRVGFLDKNSKSLTFDLREFIKEYFAFGDFVFKDPHMGIVVGRARDLKDLQDKVYKIPTASLRYHIERDHFSKWLRARALFPLAELFRAFKSDDFNNCEETKKFIYDSISEFRMAKARGIISSFNRDGFDKYFSITRIGQGSVGGKARGLAFLDSLINRNKLYNHFDKIEIVIPKTVVLGTDVFDEFMEINKLYPIAFSSEFSDDEILKRFLAAKLPQQVYGDLFTISVALSKPVAIRSSSLLEDSHYQPFAGIYNTYMLPLIDHDRSLMFEMMCTAIKAVYASAYYHDSKSYMTATSNVIDEEKMAIVIQEVCGTAYGDHYYPTFSGVARSIDYYPIAPAKPEDGTVSLALGLGKYIVDGGLSLRFSPNYPTRILQTSTPDMTLRETQKEFFALNLNLITFVPTPNDSTNLLRLKVKVADKDDAIRDISSTYDLHNHVVRDGYSEDGKKLITFSNILKHNSYPIAEILKKVLELGEREMGNPVEIEFAVDLNTKTGAKASFNLLQIRPIAVKEESINIELEKVDRDKCLIISQSALGNGTIDDLFDVVYIRPQSFSATRNTKLVDYVEQINNEFLISGRNYILIGPGRWGSSDPWLGIPVKWPQISGARLIVESGLDQYRIDPSQGTHFFQNLTSFRVGYFTINPFINDGYYDLGFLDDAPAVFENEFIRHVRFDRPLITRIDGKHNIGVIEKPMDEDVSDELS